MTIESTAATARTTVLRSLGPDLIHLPGDPGYDAARMPWNVAVDQRPAAVATPRTAAEVARIVKAAQQAGLRVAPQSIGHNPGPLGSLEDTLLLRTTAMTGVRVDPERRTARVEAGVLWRDVVEAAAEHGLACLHGSSPDVGVVGYSLGGGTGWYGRKHGLAASSITAAELVNAAGQPVRTDAEHHPDLLWALRGGGGSFGVVTALEFTLYPIETVYAGMLIWDQKDAGSVLRAWAAWCADAPDEVATAFRMLNLPPIPEIPEGLRGRSLTVIDGAVLAEDAQAEQILSALRALGPEIDTFARVPTTALSGMHMDPEGPTPAASASATLTGLPEPAIEAFLALTGPGSGSSLLSAELRQLGGALGRPHEAGGALSMLEGEFLFFGVGIAATPELGERALADASAVVDALGSWAGSRPYLNFCETQVEVAAAYADQDWLSLKAMRSAMDPDGLFRGNHPVPGLYEQGRPTA
jgi:FAD/FMN-containing dehydrogenase